ncbi:MAG: pyridoxamine 5'-phosphate oxidase family protein [Bacillota bacterium]
MSEENKLTEKEIFELLLDEPVGHLGLTKEKQPYIVPLNYLYSNGAVYFHCALEGRKIDYIRINPKACFQVGRYDGLIDSDLPCAHNYHYKSIIVEGIIEEVSDQKAKEAVLRGLVAKYADPVIAEKPISEKRIETVAVYRLIPDKISGRKNS